MRYVSELVGNSHKLVWNACIQKDVVTTVERLSHYFFQRGIRTPEPYILKAVSTDEICPTLYAPYGVPSFLSPRDLGRCMVNLHNPLLQWCYSDNSIVCITIVNEKSAKSQQKFPIETKLTLTKPMTHLINQQNNMLLSFCRIVKVFV